MSFKKCPLLIQNVENVLTAEGTGLVTALRVLYHIACPPPPVEGKDTKHHFCNNRADKIVTLSLQRPYQTGQRPYSHSKRKSIQQDC